MPTAIVDIGSASFKYDMRRLTEILAFPKAWYRRSIIRRLFLGDLTRAPVFSDGEDESGPDHSEEVDHESGIEDDKCVVISKFAYMYSCLVRPVVFFSSLI